MSTDKNGYYISLNKNTYPVIETDYTLYIYDYDSENTYIAIVTEGGNGWEEQFEKLKNMYSDLRKLETDFKGLVKAFKTLCNTNKIYFEAA